MKYSWSKAITVILALAVIAVAVFLFKVNRPLITAPKGTVPLDNKVDISSVVHLVVDEANVLSEDMEKVISIYNANWRLLKNRVMAVVTVENTENAEDDAWEWSRRLALGENDALLLIETTGGKKCVLVSGGTFREDIATLHETILTQLTYQDVHAGYFDAAVLAVFDRFHYFCGYDRESHHRAYVIEGTVTFCVLLALMMPVMIHFAAEKIDNRRFRRWYEDYGQFDPNVLPWRSVFFWHRVGSKWYEQRISGEWVDYHAGVVGDRRDRKTRWDTHR